MALQLQRLPKVNSYKIFTHYSLTCKKFCLNQFINLEEKCTILFAKLFLSNLFKHCNLSMFLEILAIASFVLLNYLMNFFLLFFCFFQFVAITKKIVIAFAYTLTKKQKENCKCNFLQSISHKTISINSISIILWDLNMNDLLLFTINVIREKYMKKMKEN